MNLKEKIKELILRGVTKVDEEVENRLKNLYKEEKDEIAKLQLENIIKNIELSKKLKYPLCQDTGLPLFFVKCRCDYYEKIRKNIEEAFNEMLDEGLLRFNTVNPITREKIKKVFIYHEPAKSGVEIVFMPKGAGSENVSAYRMLNPNDGKEGIKKFVLEVVKKAGAKPCPPIIVGVGIGGSFDISAYLSKKALLRGINKKNDDPNIAELEEEILSEINNLGIGVMGLGRGITCLSVNIEVEPCHIASLPVAVNIQCYAHRVSRLIIKEDNFEI